MLFVVVEFDGVGFCFSVVGDGDFVESFVALDVDGSLFVGGECFVGIPSFGKEFFPDFSHGGGFKVSIVECGGRTEVVSEEDPVDMG